MRHAIFTIALSSSLAAAACGGAQEAARDTNVSRATARAAPQTTPTTAPISSVGDTPPVVASHTPAPPQDAHEGHGHGAETDAVRRISVDEAHAESLRGKVLFVDVRGPDAYKQSHIKGAILVPEAEVAQNIDKLPKDKLIVTYCA